jgi:hypothetical protein
MRQLQGGRPGSGRQGQGQQGETILADKWVNLSLKMSIRADIVVVKPSISRLWRY